MKKLLIIALLAVVNMAQAQYVIEMNDGNVVKWNYELNVIQNGTGDVWSLSRTDKFNSNLELSKVKSVSIATMAERLAAYKAPNYNDDYRNNSGWDKRSSWNLANVHDPTVMRADDGYYYMYQTDASFGNVHNGNGHFHGRRSKNLVDWEYLGATMPTVPSWVKDTLDASRTRLGLPLITNPQYGYWAPCARKVKSGLYRMYYCIVVDNYIKTGKPASEAFDGSWGERAFIGLMETDDPASNNWVDKGFVLSSMSDRGKNWARSSTSDWEGYFRYNAIDPTFIITPEGEHWMIYGSWHSGFAAVQLNPETGKTLKEMPEFFTTLGTLNSVVKRVYTRTSNNRWQGSEGPEVIYRNGYYYMFMAYDGLAVPYNTRVVRSEKIDGPYFNIAGTNVTNGGDALPLMTHPYKFGNDHGWVGISHCAVWNDGNDNWYYCSQGRYPENYDTWAPNAIMLGHVRSIRWTKDGWPIVMPERYAAVPQTPITEEDIVGTWEHIDMGYNYGNQKASSDMVFSADHKITSGTWKNGTWSFDPDTNTLTANGVELLLQRECDWEASPRKHTIVYAGITNSKTYWGKKK
jgi:beta-xylosidase